MVFCQSTVTSCNLWNSLSICYAKFWQPQLPMFLWWTSYIISVHCNKSGTVYFHFGLQMLDALITINTTSILFDDECEYLYWLDVKDGSLAVCQWMSGGGEGRGFALRPPSERARPLIVKSTDFIYWFSLKASDITMSKIYCHSKIVSSSCQ